MDSTRTFTRFSVTLGIILFIYLVLRGIFVEPILDEITTFFCYVEYASFWGEGILVDANNHLLNSFLASIFHSVFGEHFFVLRLPNILSFPLFFYAIVKLSKFLEPNYLKYIFVISMTCIPFVLDYFAYCRGYGMSMAFLMMAIYLFIQNNTAFHWKKLLLLSLLLLLAIYSNLNLLITAMLIFGFIFIKEVIAVRTQKSYRHLIQLFIAILLFVILLLPALSYASMLKEVGALYYGNKDGLWLTTGITLSRNVLFTESNVVKYTLIIVSLFLFVHSCILLSKKAIFSSAAFIFIFLFFGNLAAILAMRWLLDVNYPEDRVGMYLIFLLIGSTIFSLQYYQKIVWLSGIFLLLPILGWKHFNFRTSVFSPDDRIEKSDFELFKSNISSDESSSIYFTQLSSYIYHVRKNNPTNFVVPSISTDFSEEIILHKGASKEGKLEGHERIRYNRLTNLSIFKRKEPLTWKTIVVQELPFVKTTAIYHNLIDSTFWQQAVGQSKIIIECKLTLSQVQQESVVLIVNTVNQKGESNYENFHLNWVAGKNKTYQFKKIIEYHPDEIKELSVYLFNPKELDFTLLKHKISLNSVQ